MQPSWIKPQQGNMKCNVDASCYAAENRYSIGACIRDEHGRFVKAMSAHFVGQPAVHEAEAQGLLVALKWLQQMQITSMINIEMDCLQVVQNYAGNVVNLTEYGSLIGKCKTLLTLFHNCTVSFVRRQAN
jgi:ribonuclease HI